MHASTSAVNRMVLRSDILIIYLFYLSMYYVGSLKEKKFQGKQRNKLVFTHKEVNESAISFNYRNYTMNVLFFMMSMRQQVHLTSSILLRFKALISVRELQISHSISHLSNRKTLVKKQLIKESIIANRVEVKAGPGYLQKVGEK